MTKKHPLVDVVNQLRECVKCKRLLPFSNYHKHSVCKGGVNTVCKECRHPLSRKEYSTRSKSLLMWQRAKARALASGAEFSISPEDVIIPAICPVLKVPFSKGRYSMSLDRIDPTKGYTKDNIQVISYKANSMKNDASASELLAFAEWVTTNYVCEIL